MKLNIINILLEYYHLNYSVYVMMSIIQMPIKALEV